MPGFLVRCACSFSYSVVRNRCFCSLLLLARDRAPSLNICLCVCRAGNPKGVSPAGDRSNGNRRLYNSFRVLDGLGVTLGFISSPTRCFQPTGKKRQRLNPDPLGRSSASTNEDDTVLLDSPATGITRRWSGPLK